MSLPRLHIKSLLMLAMLTMAGGGVFLQAQTVITPDAESKLWIEGRSNINRFSCMAEEYEGEAIIGSQTIREFAGQSDEQIRLELKIPVRSFECGRSRMNRDLYDALKSDEFFYITFDFKDARTLPGSNTDSYKLEIEGVLTIAGTSRDIKFEAEGFLLDNNQMRAIGQKTIRMSDYNVEPPTGLLGLVRAENELTVHFDLYASSQ